MIKNISRVVAVYNKKTCIRLTDVEWRILDEICFCEKLKRKKLLEQISTRHTPYLKLTPTVRLFSLLYLYGQNKNLKNGQSEINLENILNQLL